MDTTSEEMRLVYEIMTWFKNYLPCYEVVEAVGRAGFQLGLTSIIVEFCFSDESKL
jgi:hypothetical protein